MTTSLVLTFVSHDKPGLVSAISEKIADAEGSWLESRLARLAGEFAGIVLISVPDANAPGLTAALHSLEEAGLRITVERTTSAPPEISYRTLDLELLGQDRPGIVRDVTHALGQLGANIEEFSSGIESAPFTGETMFRAAARLRVPGSVTTEDVQKILERLAEEMMVDLTSSENEDD
ncbi:glycine cleavage system protein R [Acidocella aquatica]|uniref:Glycine cleavage system protein R n=1 Tax=Acidocella aquatica TaxID=1922313 RepID=A0ABQ6A795_9PROT|nr:ACT domain-containing protein [Acidocella aquatica]GLR67183.1 glycine cleavage system protein R [Acidocella aquatica]